LFPVSVCVLGTEHRSVHLRVAASGGKLSAVKVECTVVGCLSIQMNWSRRCCADWLVEFTPQVCCAGLCRLGGVVRVVFDSGCTGA
jgi:hypothetical protein